MKENGKVIKDKVLVYKFGQMVPNMKDIGIKTKQMDMVNFTMQMEIYLMDYGKMTKRMVLVYIYVQMGQNMKENGKMI